MSHSDVECHKFDYVWHLDDHDLGSGRFLLKKKRLDCVHKNELSVRLSYPDWAFVVKEIQIKGFLFWIMVSLRRFVNFNLTNAPIKVGWVERWEHALPKENQSWYSQRFIFFRNSPMAQETRALVPGEPFQPSIIKLTNGSIKAVLHYNKLERLARDKHLAYSTRF